MNTYEHKDLEQDSSEYDTEEAEIENETAEDSFENDADDPVSGNIESIANLEDSKTKPEHSENEVYDSETEMDESKTDSDEPVFKHQNRLSADKGTEIDSKVREEKSEDANTELARDNDTPESNEVIFDDDEGWNDIFKPETLKNDSVTKVSVFFHFRIRD